jgi:NAD(P)-dependent dehydrogenase (short-subunit alcohol dehydrogenase family)
MGRIETWFGRTSTAAEVVRGIDLSGTRVIVTGASSGIGVETARALARTGAEVTLAVRDVDAGERAAEDILASTPGALLVVSRLDLADGDSIDTFVRRWEGRVHALVLNAGIMATPEERTAEGWELQFATNHLGHLQLALGLHPYLAADRAARIVSVSSAAHLRSPVVFDDINFEERPYDPWQAYAQSKTANVLFAVEATRRWEADGITANAVMPGGIWTRLQKHVDEATRAQWDRELAAGTIPPIKSPEQGAATSVLLATSPALEGIGGRYFEDCAEAELREDGEEARSGVRRWALDPDAADRLWDASLEMLAERAALIGAPR